MSPRAKKLSSVSDSSRLAGTATVTEAVPFTDPEVALTVVEPSATEVTNPVEDTVATEAADVAHVTLAPLIAAPFWSLTVAESCCVAPIDEKLRLVAESVIDVATGVGGVGGVGGVVGELPPSPHPRSRSTAAKARSLNLNFSGCPYEGHVPHTGRGRTHEVAPSSKSSGLLVMRDTHQPLKF